MSKNKILIELAKNLRNLASSIEVLDGTLEVNQVEAVTPDKVLPKGKVEDKPTETKDEPKGVSKPKQPTLEEVRAAMAEKNREGHREEVKAIIVNHGANKLTALDPKCYTEVLKEVGEIK